jgi:competence protein ComEC
MIAGMLAAAGGIVVVTRLPVLPALPLVAALLPLLVPLLLGPWRPLRLAALFALGAAWGTLSAHRMLAHALPAGLEGKDLRFAVCIEGLPESRREPRGEVWRLRARILGAAPGAPSPWPGRRVQFSWYGQAAFAPGEAWEVPLRLRAPRGFANPGGRDLQAWLLGEGIDATGYAATGKGRSARRIGRCAAGADPWRATLRERLKTHFAGQPSLPALLAVTLGDGSGFTPADWDRFARTGTTHLVVISGMHIALVAGLACAGGALLARAVPVLLLRLPARAWGALLALPAMLAYAALAGWTVSVRRAALMCAALLLCVLAGRAPPAWTGFACAVLALLVLQPLAAMQAGFWLSFVAVAALLLGFGGRLVRPGRIELIWRPQLVVLAALVVPVALAGQSQALPGPLVNALAIPLVDLLVVPPALAGCLALPVAEPLALALLRFALYGLDGLDALLRLAERWSPPLIAGTGEAVPWRIALAAAGSAWLLAPRGVPGRALGLALLLPLLQPSPRPAALLELLALDVGQGSAVIVRTARHALVYDAGPRYGPRFEAGAGVVAPALRWLGSERVDRLVLSHADLDHAGGAPGLLRAIPVGEVLAGEPVRDVRSVPCARGQRWHWDGVEFEVLHPAATRAGSGNEGSCVLRIRAGAIQLLLAGDIGQPGERALLAAEGDALASAVLLVPHHGSGGSSGAAFVRAVRPRYAIVSAGHGNRFGHPRPDVVARYRAVGAEVLETARAGALLLRVGSDGRLAAPLAWRVHARRFWYRD